MYTYTYTPMSKVKTIQQKIKYNRLTWQTKEIKKLYFAVKNKLTKALTGKQN